jgi:hypothetical protein
MNVEDWFETLPEPYRARALDQSECLDDECESLVEAISNGLVWTYTDEGVDFWKQVAEHYTDPALTDLPNAGALALMTTIKTNELWRFERIKALAKEIVRQDDVRLIKGFVRELNSLI